jgi:hypothetical protein
MFSTSNLSFTVNITKLDTDRSIPRPSIYRQALPSHPALQLWPWVGNHILRYRSITDNVKGQKGILSNILVFLSMLRLQDYLCFFHTEFSANLVELTLRQFGVTAICLRLNIATRYCVCYRVFNLNMILRNEKEASFSCIVMSGTIE